MFLCFKLVEKVVLFSVTFQPAKYLLLAMLQIQFSFAPQLQTHVILAVCAVAVHTVMRRAGHSVQLTVHILLTFSSIQ